MSRHYAIYFKSRFDERPNFYMNSVGFWRTRKLLKTLNRGGYTWDLMDFGYFYAVRN